MSSAKAIADAITAGFKLLKTVLDTAEVRRIRKCIDMAEKYIQVNEEMIKEPDAKQRAKLRKRLLYYKKKFFQFN